MQSSHKKTVNKVKEKRGPVEESERFEYNIRKKIANIEKKYAKSVVNQLYIFPRMLDTDADTSSSSSEEDIESSYNLKSQNLKSRKNQTKTVQNLLILERPSKGIARQYQSAQSQISLHSVEQGGKTLKNKSRKSKNIEISFNTKKKTPHTKNNSQHKLFQDQYSLDNRVYASSKDRLVVSFRGQKRHQINISLSGRRMKTEIQ